MSTLSWLSVPVGQGVKTPESMANTGPVPTRSHHENSSTTTVGTATARASAQSADSVSCVPTVPTAKQSPGEKTGKDPAKTAGLRHVGELLPRIVTGVALASAGIVVGISDSGSPPMRAVVPYILRNGSGGQIVDPNGLLSAVTELHARYRKRLNLEKLAAWLEQRVTQVWPVCELWQVEQERKALTALQAIMEKPQ